VALPPVLPDDPPAEFPPCVAAPSVFTIPDDGASQAINGIVVSARRHNTRVRHI
jgi:hypothetical protein